MQVEQGGGHEAFLRVVESTIKLQTIYGNPIEFQMQVMKKGDLPLPVSA